MQRKDKIMTKLKATLVILTLASSSVVLANTDFKIPTPQKPILTEQSEDVASQLPARVSADRGGTLTETHFFEY